MESDSPVASILAYIKNSWRVLSRSHAELTVAAPDPKFPVSGRWPVYVHERELEAVRRLLHDELDPKAWSEIELRPLPEDRDSITEHGLLFLPHPYVVPGGRFNEMYGWDSYFILLGLLRDGEFTLGKHVVDNHLYQVDRYGAVLNANRTYYLSRSQPPFLSRMVLDIYQRTGDREWLGKALPTIEKYYAYWMTEPHLVPETGLSRYHAFGFGPAPEVVAGEVEDGQNHYERVRDWFRANAKEPHGFDLEKYYDVERNELTDLFYVADRSMRESGFDPSGRFGSFNVGVLDYNPVCLNALLWVMEGDIATIRDTLGLGGAGDWRARAQVRREAVDRLLWDEKQGMYLDYDFTRRERRQYPFATGFFPLWAGMSSPQQAARLVENLPAFERPGGIVTSTKVSGTQWDAPYGWAPLEHVAVKGLRRYGYNAEADRLSVSFLSLVLQEFRDHNAIFEKYDVEKRRSTVSAGLRFGYSSNEIGFGWTNAAWLELWADLNEARRADVLRLALPEQESTVTRKPIVDVRA